MAEENKKKTDELESADKLLERLSGAFDAGKEKSAAKPDGGKNNDAASAKAVLEDTLGGELTDTKYNELYKKYLGDKVPEEKPDADFETLHEKLLDLQSDGAEKSEGDVEKSIKDAEMFVTGETEAAKYAEAQLKEEKPDEKPSEDDEYWAMMKTEQVTIKKKAELPEIKQKPEAEDDSELKKNIKDAENYVEENYRETGSEEPQVQKNVDNYSTNPDLAGKKKEKKKLFGIRIPEKKSQKSDAERIETPEDKVKPETEYDETFIDRLGSTAELLAYEPPMPQREERKTAENTKPADNAASKPENTSEIKKTETEKGPEEKTDPSDTAMMMMAFGYEPKKEDPQTTAKPEYDEYAFSDTDELSTTANLGDTSMLETDTVQTNKAVTEMLDRPLFEYTDADKNKEIFDGFRKKFNSLRIRMFACALIAAGLLIWEFLLPMLGVSIADTGIFVAVDWVLSFACAMLVCDRLVFAVRRLGKFRFDADTVTLLMFVISLVTSVIAIVTAPTTFTEIKMYNFSFALCAFFNMFSASLLLSRDIYAFKVISSQKQKKVLARVAGTERSREDIAFGEYLNKSSDVCKIKKTDFVSDFFSNREEAPKNRKPLAIIIPAIFCVSVAAFFVSMFAYGADLYSSVTNAYLTFIMCAPLSVFISYSYPAYLGSVRAYSHGSSILSEAAPEKYVDTAVLSFSDEDAFPPERIKIKSVKVLDNLSIDKVIYYASSVYSKIGGPLATVFKSAALDSATSDKVEIKELSDQGIDAIVDERHIVVGQPDYMENQCFETIKEDSDDEYGGKSNKRILYLACDEVVIAKFYIQYNTSPDFIYIVKHLYEDGICVAINTIDPCIDEGILYKNRLDPEQYAIKIIKGSVPQEASETVSAHECGIASTGTLKGMIKTLLLCDKLTSISKTNLAMKIVTAVIGAVIAALLIVAAPTSPWLWVIYPLYQLFWLVPMFLVSKVYVR